MLQNDSNIVSIRVQMLTKPGNVNAIYSRRNAILICHELSFHKRDADRMKVSIRSEGSVY
jgi:hypothetical protein